MAMIGQPQCIISTISTVNNFPNLGNCISMDITAVGLEDGNCKQLLSSPRACIPYLVQGDIQPRFGRGSAKRKAIASRLGTPSLNVAEDSNVITTPFHETLKGLCHETRASAIVSNRVL